MAAGTSQVISAPMFVRPIRARLVAPKPPVVAVVPVLPVSRPSPL